MIKRLANQCVWPAFVESAVRRQRRGSLYVSIVMVSAIVSVLGMSALLVGRINSRAHQGLADSTTARLNAQSALRLGMLMIENDPDWRFSNTTDEWLTDVSLGSGTFSLSITDPSDNDLSDASADPVVLTGIGKKGDAVHQVEITLAPLYRGYDCLQSAIHSGHDLNFRYANATADHMLSVNRQVNAVASSVFADVEAVTQVRGAYYYGSTKVNATSRTLPSTAEVLEFYQANGTAIDVSDLPTSYANVISNSDFETGHIPWFGASSTTTQEMGLSYEGGACLKVADRIDAACGASHDVTNLVKSNATYRVDFAVQQATDLESYYVHLQFETTSGTGRTTAGPFIPTALNEWQTGSLSMRP